MRMQGKANRDPQKKSMGEKTQHIQQPEDEKKAVQKRTFTRWMNGFLQRREPPIEVYDLFTDIQDGRILMALLEELSGCQLLYRFRSSSHRIFRLNNISKALTFLDDRHVKLLGIDASGIADGIPSVVLNLVWNMILYFQVQEVTAGLQRHLSSSLSSLSMSSYPSSSDLSPPPNDISSYFCSTLPSKCKKAAKQLKFGVEVHDFGRSWRSGLAFLAMIKSINTALVDLRASLSREPRENIKLAFMLAHHNLDIPPLLEPEDVSGTSPDEQSIITYVSMFLRFCPDKDEDDTTDMEVPDIPHFGSLESVSIGETLADDPDAQALLQGMKKSSEQLLWKRWARRSQGSPCATSLHTTETTSPFNQSKSRSRSILQPPSPLDAGVANQDIRSWMEKAPADQEYSKPRVDESHFSLSSEEGIYSLSALDSDEEDAYSYILDLNKEVFQPYNQIQKQVPRVEEETEEEMFLNGEHAESKHLEECEILNGCTHQEDSLVQHVASEVRDQSVVHRMLDRDTNERSSTEVADSIAAFDIEPKEDSREEQEDERAVRGQSNAAGDDSEEEREKTGKARFDKRDALIDESKNTRVFEAASWNREVEEDTEKGLFEKCRQVSKKVLESEEEEHGATFEERQQGEERVEEDNVKEEEREEWGGSAKATAGDHPDKTASEDNTNGGVNVHPASSATSWLFGERGFLFQSPAAFCGVTPLELDMLLLLWILLYCYFILPQMNF
ncbi:hypothetical protein KUCAC02_019677 [Chaenocephalus aceratus]|uniref:Uncharacterized protein n=1 Tax=Chaenocephalus aceratus TaxID=36190 RepID=A0ACB9VQH4_CHAAC|nr:hypothetical protein KUCAC02_019677 [Chaenocephalus aceratus]